MRCRLARFLYKQHTTVHTAAGKPPSWMLHCRELQYPLENLNHGPSYEPSASSADPEEFSVVQEVWIRKILSRGTWMAGTITGHLGPRSCMIYIGQGQTRRHIEHIRPKNSMSAQNEYRLFTSMGRSHGDQRGAKCIPRTDDCSYPTDHPLQHTRATIDRQILNHSQVRGKCHVSAGDREMTWPDARADPRFSKARAYGTIRFHGHWDSRRH